MLEKQFEQLTQTMAVCEARVSELFTVLAVRGWQWHTEATTTSLMSTALLLVHLLPASIKYYSATTQCTSLQLTLHIIQVVKSAKSEFVSEYMMTDVHTALITIQHLTYVIIAQIGLL